MSLVTHHDVAKMLNEELSQKEAEIKVLRLERDLYLKQLKALKLVVEQSLTEFVKCPNCHALTPRPKCVWCDRELPSS